MEYIFLGLIVFLFLLAIFDLFVGVSNDAVNFLSSAVGSRAASFRTVMIVAGVGVFIGASLSNGMMDVARHGIFRPENLSFYDITAIFMAVMVTDVILLNMFNTLGMPTSTTVSLVFELLGASFVVALFKLAQPDSAVHMGDLLNTEKALQVIIGIFLSVAIAFVFGIVVQFISRLLFSFNYRDHTRIKTDFFGGIACTAIVYFMLIKGIKDLTIMTPELKAWIDSNTTMILLGCFVVFTLLMELLNVLRVNVFKVIVLLGTFSLAMAFAGNDLVNFIGVPLTSLASYQDFAANGAGNVGGFMMGSLNGPSSTPFYYLVGAGMIMVIALSTSPSARQVTQTTVGLSSQSQGDEMFGSSRISRTLVRHTLNLCNNIADRIPLRIRQWIDKRMDISRAEAVEGQSFDLLRASVNLMLAGLLIAFGTSLKLPLSTTFVTFMVAMGTSLADRAWGRESAVFRITGVMSVIGGWFVTAGIAFIGAGFVVCLMHLGGVPVMIAGGIIAIAILIRSHLRHRHKQEAERGNNLFHTILTAKQADVWPMTKLYINEQQSRFLQFAADMYGRINDGFYNDHPGELGKVAKKLQNEKTVLKNSRRKLTLCMRRVAPEIAIEKNTWFYLGYSTTMSMLYNMLHINEVCHEHVNNNFYPLPEDLRETFLQLSAEVVTVIGASADAAMTGDATQIDDLRRTCDKIKSRLTAATRQVYAYLQSGDASRQKVAYVYLNYLQESQEFVTSLRKMLRAAGKLNITPSNYRSFSETSRLVDLQGR